mmetsp:Transcript_2322/g.4426  ORF Transcript_2322/g.4426 Transcript_2322/m.4426 type:complete len:119 (+) Transcript_2322:128-484(+)
MLLPFDGETPEITLEETNPKPSGKASNATVSSVPQPSGRTEMKEHEKRRRKRRAKSPGAPKHPSSPFLHFARESKDSVTVNEILDGTIKRGTIMSSSREKMERHVRRGKSPVRAENSR